MIQLLLQIWGFLIVAWLIGLIVGGVLMYPRRTMRLKEVEQDLRAARDRGIGFEKEALELRAKVGELEGIPEAERRSRIAAREDLISRIAKLEADISVSRANERQAKDETDKMRVEMRELNAKLAQEKAKAEAIALTPAQALPPDGFDAQIASLRAHADDAQKTAETKSAEAASLKAKLVELEGRVARALEGAKDADAFKSRVLELEAQLRQESTAAAERLSALQARNAELDGKLREAAAAPKAVPTGPDLMPELIAARREAEQAAVLRSRVGDLESRSAQLDDARRHAAELQAKTTRLETELANAMRDSGATQSLQSKIADLETRLGAEQSRAASEALKFKDELQRANAEASRLAGRLTDAEARMAQTQAAAAEASSLRARLAEVEGRAEQLAKTAGDADSLRSQVQDQAARLRELDANLRAAAQSNADTGPLRARIAELERRLVDAQRAHDEAAILRAQVAEMDGRLGQALRAAAEADSLRARLAASEQKPA